AQVTSTRRSASQSRRSRFKTLKARPWPWTIGWRAEASPALDGGVGRPIPARHPLFSLTPGPHLEYFSIRTHEFCPGVRCVPGLRAREADIGSSVARACFGLCIGVVLHHHAETCGSMAFGGCPAAAIAQSRARRSRA